MQLLHFIVWSIPYWQEGESDLIMFLKKIQNNHNELIFQKCKQATNLYWLKLESENKQDIFSKKKDTTTTWKLNSFWNSSNMKRPNLNYHIFVEKRSYK